MTDFYCGRKGSTVSKTFFNNARWLNKLLSEAERIAMVGFDLNAGKNSSYSIIMNPQSLDECQPFLIRVIYLPFMLASSQSVVLALPV